LLYASTLLIIICSGWAPSIDRVTAVERIPKNSTVPILFILFFLSPAGLFDCEPQCFERMPLSIANSP